MKTDTILVVCTLNDGTGKKMYNSFMTISQQVMEKCADDHDGLTRQNIWAQLFKSIVSLTSSLVVKMLTVLVSIISNSQVFLLKKWVAFANANATHIFSSNILVYMPYLMIS